MALATSICLLAHGASESGSEALRRFDLRGGDAAEVLARFARISGAQIIFPAEALRGVRTPELHGDFTVVGALHALLADRGFEVVFDAATDSYAIRKPASSNTAVRPRSATAPVATAVREAPTTLPPVSVERRREYATAAKTILPVERSAPLYYHVVTREEIEQSGATNIAEFLTTVPGYSGEGAESLQASADLRFAAGANVNVGSFLKLRGWDSRHTAVLLNGRRLPPSPESNGPDLSRVPLAAVERIEVLPFAGSALYGDGAVGGAMNIVLRKDVVGPSLSMQLGTSTRGGGGEAEATWIQGWLSRDERTNVTITGDYEHHDMLRLGRRDFLARTIQRLPPATLLGTDGFGPNFRPVLQAELVGYPAIFTTTASAVTLGIPDQPLAQFAFVPAGANAAQLVPSSFVTTNPAAQAERRQNRVVLRPPTDIASVTAQVDHSIFPEKLELYGELGVSRVDQRFSAPDTIEPLSLTITDPRNPFRRGVTSGFSGRSTYFYFDPLDLPDARLDQSRSSFRGVLGLRGKPAQQWHWSLDSFLDYSTSESTIESFGASLDDLLRNWTPANEAALVAIYDPFADHLTTPVSTAARDRYLSRRSWLRYHSLMFGSELRVGGVVGRLPAGPVRLELGAEYEWRDHFTHQGATASSELYSLLGALQTYADFTQPAGSVDRGNRLGALGEAVLPLVRDGKPRIPIHSAEFDVASRVARTDRGSPAASNLVALKVAPSRAFALRATFSQGQVTPSSEVVNAPVTQTSTVVSVIDPLRGNVQQLYPVQLIQGGSGTLESETSQARVLGLIFTPQSLPGLFFTVDAWSIRMNNRQRTPTVQELVSYADYFPDKLTRNAPLAWEKALGWAGPVTKVDLRPVHVTRLESDGIDVAVRYRGPRTRLGIFSFNGQLETVQRYAEQLLPVTALVDKINVVTDGTGSGLMEAAVVTPRLRATIGWERSGWFGSVTGSYAPRYQTDTTMPSPAQPTATGADGDHIASSTLWDMQFGYSTGHQARWLPDTTWTLGVRNLFDREPPPRADGTAFYSRFDDPRMRFIYLRVQWRR